MIGKNWLKVHRLSLFGGLLIAVRAFGSDWSGDHWILDAVGVLGLVLTVWAGWLFWKPEGESDNG